MAYGFFHIDVCKQSPVIIQFQSSTPVGLEPIYGIGVFTSDLYNRVLGYGKFMECSRSLLTLTNLVNSIPFTELFLHSQLNDTNIETL